MLTFAQREIHIKILQFNFNTPNDWAVIIVYLKRKHADIFV